MKCPVCNGNGGFGERKTKYYSYAPRILCPYCKGSIKIGLIRGLIYIIKKAKICFSVLQIYCLNTTIAFRCLSFANGIGKNGIHC